jgi:hypothetical protein
MYFHVKNNLLQEKATVQYTWYAVNAKDIFVRLNRRHLRRSFSLLSYCILCSSNDGLFFTNFLKGQSHEIFDPRFFYI